MSRRFRSFQPVATVRTTIRAAALACALALAGAGAAHGQPQHEGPLLTVEEAVRMALEANPGILAARSEVRIAQNNYTRGNAGYLPSVGASARQARSNGGPSDGALNYDVAVGAGIPVFDGFRRSAAYRRLGAQVEQAGLQAQQYTEGTLADLITLYFDLARQQEQRAVLRDAVDISRERLRIATLGRDLGSTSELEVRRARVDLNADSAAVLRQDISLANTKAQFNLLLGRPGEAPFTVADSLEIGPVLEAEALAGEAEAANTSLRLAEAYREVARAAERETRAEWFPRLDLQVGYIFNDIGSEVGLPVTRPGGLSYGLSASFDLFEGFNRSRRLENARLQIAISELEITEARTRLSSGLYSAYASYRNSLDLAALEAENEALAQQNVAVALARFRLGGINSIELREVQNALTNAGSRLVTARFEAKRAQISLLELSGRLQQQYGLGAYWPSRR